MNKTTIEQVRNLIADDAYAVTFQSMAQYRSALLAALSSAESEPTHSDASKAEQAIFATCRECGSAENVAAGTQRCPGCGATYADGKPEAPELTDAFDDFDIDNPPPLYPITWEQVKPYAIDWLLPDENLFEKENLPVLRFAQGLLADFASPDAQAAIRASKSQASQPAQETCEMCHGREVISGYAQDGSYDDRPCPECSQPSQVKEPPVSLTSGEGEVRQEEAFDKWMHDRLFSDPPKSVTPFDAWQAALAQSPARKEPKIDFNKPLETVDGESVKYVCGDVVEYKCARICVDSETGVSYSSPYIGLRIRNVAASAPHQPDSGEKA